MIDRFLLSRQLQRVADPRTLGWWGDPLTKFPILVRGVAPPTKFSQIAFGAARFTSRPEARGSGVEAVFRFLGSGVDFF